MKKILKSLGLFLLACFGLSGIGYILHEAMGSNWETSFIKSAFIIAGFFLCGSLLMLPFVRSVVDLWKTWREEAYSSSYINVFKQKTRQYSELLKKDVFQLGKTITEDTTGQEALISRFKTDYDHFFFDPKTGIRENHPLQSTATQIYWNVLRMQKLRLDRLKIRMNLDAQRMVYGKETSPVYAETAFDGKYEISDVSEMIRANRKFYAGEKCIGNFPTKELAKYHMLNTRTVGKNHIICPNCGNAATRENLIDGCDYCHQKFVVEDLGMRVSDFGLFPDSDVEKIKYKEAKAEYGLRVALISLLPCFLYVVYDTILQVLASPNHDGFLFEFSLFLVFIVLRTLFFAGLMVLLFYLTVFPLLQIKRSILHPTKKKIKLLKNAEQNNQIIAQTIRKQDPLFSLGEFYSNMQNKLAVLHYADHGKKMSAFTEGNEIQKELVNLPEVYASIVNMDLASVRILDYTLEHGYQVIDVAADLILLELKGEKIRKRTEEITVQLVKNENCKTEAVCAPSFMVCKNCGASHSLLDGKYCEYCGHERKLSEYDWAIRKYQYK